MAVPTRAFLRATARLGGRLVLACAIAAFGWSLAGPGTAQVKPAASQAPSPGPAATSGPGWTSLTPGQRLALAPLERDWPAIEEPRKTKWLELAQHFHKLPPEEQQRVQQRMTEWARLSPAQRGRARLNFQESKQFTAQEKQEHWQSYQALSSEQRKALANVPRADGSPAKVPALPASAAGNPAPRLVKPVSPTVVQAKPGATTSLMTKTPQHRPEQRPGQPVISAQPGQVDSSTLLPRSGPQAAKAASSPGSP